MRKSASRKYCACGKEGNVMPQESIAIALVLAAMFIVSFWRQLLLLALALLVAVFCFGLIYLAELLRL
jgi:hypothetical protein